MRIPAFATVLTSLVSLSVAPAFAADLHEGYAGTQRASRHTIVSSRLECDLLRIDYRRPYIPSSEIVDVCYPPLDLTPTGSRSSGGTYITTVTSYAVQ